MLKRNILFTAIVLGCVFGSAVAIADPIVELAAPRVTSKVVSGDTAQKTKKTEKQKSSVKASKKLLSKHRLKGKKLVCKKHKPVCKKSTPILVNYDRVAKMIEYGYYDDADKILEGAISRNQNDIKAQALRAISLAKQSKLDPAQQELDVLLKKYPDNSNLHYAQGVVYYQRTASSNLIYRDNSSNLISDAMCEFQKAVKLDKNNAYAYNALGVVSINQNKLKDAEVYFKKAITSDKTYSLAIDNLGTLDFIANKLKDAEKRFKESLIYNTQNTTAMYHLAQIAMLKKDYFTAIKYLNNALYINSNSPAIYNLLGKAYSAQGNEAAAINAFKHSVAVKPEFTLSYLDLADIYQQRGDNEFAIEQLKTALAIEPNYNDAKLRLADISLGTGKYKEAIDTYAQLVGVDNYNEAALKGLANAYYGQAQSFSNKPLGSAKDVFVALDSINKAIAANPQDLELYLAKLKLTKFLNQPNETRNSFNKIVSSPNNNLPSLIVKGEAYIALNDYRNAKNEFDSAIKLSKTPNDDLYLAEILLLSKQYDSAQIMLDKIIKYAPKNLEALNGIDYIKKNKQVAFNYYKSGLFFERQKNLASAIEYYSNSLSLDPNNAEAHLMLARLLEKKKDNLNAVNHYKAYLSLCKNPADKAKIQSKIKKLDNTL